MIDFVVPRRLPVAFCADLAHPVDTRPFDQASYESILQDGLSISKWGLILDAAVHYQTRHRKNLPMRWTNALVDLSPSLAPSWSGGFVNFGGAESNEFQTGSTEVIAVGLAIGLCRKLFDVKRNDIFVIEGTSARMDFWVQKGDERFTIEARGRKGGLGSAVNGVYAKKPQGQDRPNAHYGVVARIPRDGTSASAIVVDPPQKVEGVPDYLRARLLLRHYARVSLLAGFWRLSSHLHERADRLLSDEALRSLQGRRLEYGNVLKLGRTLRFDLGFDGRWEVFVNPATDLGLRETVGEYQMLLGMDPRLVELLESQDLYGLLDYPTDSSGPDKPLEIDRGYVLPRDDGSLGILLRADGR